jgi:protein TonB
MSRLSIYEARWIDLVFENKNKEYGAYQLRSESARTTVIAFFSGILLISVLGGIFTLSNLLGKPIVLEIPRTIDEPLHITPYVVEPIRPKTIVNTSQAKTPTEPTALLPIVVSATPDVIDAVPTNTTIENHPLNPGTTGGTGTANTGIGTIESPTLPIDGNVLVNATALDKLPEFPGGINKFYTYVGNNFEKPEIDGMSSIRVYVSFVIEKDGSMTNILVKRDPGYGLGKEAIRVLKSLRTKWSPGMIGSKPVRTAYDLPITVQMD